VVVGSVDPSSVAAAAGLGRGDVIQEVDRKPVHSISEYKQALAAVGKQQVLLLVNQGGVTRYVVIESH
jgi:serine protease Do